MIPLPPGVTISYEVIVTLSDLSEEFLAWWQEIEGNLGYTSYINGRGKEIKVPQIQYGQGRASHKFNNDTGEYLVRFRSEDAGVALALLMKWDKLVISHNMREDEKYVY